VTTELDRLLHGKLPDGNAEICAHGCWFDGMRMTLDPTRRAYRIPVSASRHVPHSEPLGALLCSIEVTRTERCTYDGRIVYELVRHAAKGA
jgi:hypothetical protein